MGPAATVAFLARLQALTPAKGDGDHIRVLVDINPHVPDRNRRPGEAEAELARMAAGLRDMGAEVLAMPCNTAHAQSAGIRAAGPPFIDMIAQTVRAASASGGRRIGVLATPGGERLYVDALTGAGLEPVLLESEDRLRLMDLIYGVKAGDVGEAARADMARLAALLADKGAQAVIAGCTEIPLLLGGNDLSVPLVDSTEALARACVHACL